MSEQTNSIKSLEFCKIMTLFAFRVTLLKSEYNSLLSLDNLEQKKT